MASDENGDVPAPGDERERLLRYPESMIGADGNGRGQHVLAGSVEQAVGYAMARAAAETWNGSGEGEGEPGEREDPDAEVEGTYYNHRSPVPHYEWRAIAGRSEEICAAAVARVAAGDEVLRYRIGRDRLFPRQSPEMDAGAALGAVFAGLTRGVQGGAA